MPEARCEIQILVTYDAKSGPRSYHASVVGHREWWGAGKTPEQAIGSLMMTWSDQLGIELSVPDVAPMWERPAPKEQAA